LGGGVHKTAQREDRIKVAPGGQEGSRKRPYSIHWGAGMGPYRDPQGGQRSIVTLFGSFRIEI
jgi:hypothetical protein